MSLRETHQEAGGNFEVTVYQEAPWLSDPESYYQMPLTVRLERGKQFIDHLVTVSGSQSTHALEKP